MTRVFSLHTFLAVLFTVLALTSAKKGATKEADPKECEVCVNNLEMIAKLIPSDKKGDRAAIEKVSGK